MQRTETPKKKSTKKPKKPEKKKKDEGDGDDPDPALGEEAAEQQTRLRKGNFF